MNNNLVSRAWAAMLFLILLTVLAGPANPASAQATAPKDYTRVTEDGKYLLVMLAPDGTGQTDPALRRKYSQPGLYPNDGSTTPVWTTEWATWYQDLPDSKLYTNPDGKYMARLDAAPRLALAFYVIGIEVKRYGLNELVPNQAAQPRQTGEVGWVQKANLDTVQNRLVVDTAGDERLEFSMTTGHRLPGIGKPDSIPMVMAIVLMVVFTLPFAVIAYIGIRRQIKRQAAG